MTSLYAPSAEDVKQRLRPFGFFFEKSLKDLIRGIRSHNETPESLEAFLEKQLSECREEANSSNLEQKTNAVLKLTYLEMYGYDMSWCNFHILEVMSSNKLQQKRVGYLAASQSFHKDMDVLMLATNLLKKDLKYGGSNDTFKVGIALSGLSTIVTPDLSKDIVDDLIMMLNSSKPYIRKKTITALFKVFLEYPEALQDNFDKFTSKLEDDDTSVLSATVSVICELSKQNPAPFIKLSPLLYEILFTTDNNWIIIRLLKLFTNLSKIEPKLKAKLLPNILELMDSTSATSVIYEAVNCIVTGEMLDESDYDVAIQCLDRLGKFCESQDPNLRYISCVLFYKIGKINTQFISQYDTLIIQLIGDVDISIRLKAVELLKGIVSDSNLKLIVSTLMKQFVDKEVAVVQTNRGVTKEIPIVIPEDYKHKISHTIIDLCSMDNYNNLDDFEWYNATLYDLSIISQDFKDTDIGIKLGDQLRNLMVRVPAVRQVTITNIIKICSLEDIDVKMSSILSCCIWSLGEYASYLENGDALINLFIQRGFKYDFETQSVLIVALVKLFSHWCNGGNVVVEDVKRMLLNITTFLDKLTHSKYFEVQEISSQMYEIMKLCLDAVEDNQEDIPMLLTDVVPSFFNHYELTPIAAGTQMQLPKGIDFDIDTPFLTSEELDEVIDEQETLADEDVDIYDSDRFSLSSTEDNHYADNGHYDDGSSGEENRDDFSDTYKEFTDTYKKEKLSNPFYLDESSSATQETTSRDIFTTDNDTEERILNPIDVVKLSKESTSVPSADSEKSKKKKKKKTKKPIVLADQIISIPGVPESDVISKSNASISPSVGSGKITLSKHTNLGDFQFNNPSNETNEDDEELHRLREKFQQQTLSDNAEEVVIIKKKQKKSKSKHSKKSKKKTKESADEEASVGLLDLDDKNETSTT